MMESCNVLTFKRSTFPTFQHLFLLVSFVSFVVIFLFYV